MKALLSIQPGGPDTLVLSEVPAPSAGPGQVVVDVKACGVNFPDVLIIEDKYQDKPPRPFAPGAEVAGVVRSVGEGVTTVQRGDRVLALLRWGGMVEQAVIAADQLVQVPPSMPFDEAAAFMLTYGTSFHALQQRGALQPGQRLLVLGAAGGVGLAAVQLGKAMGAHVVAAASSEEKLDLCRRHGADAGVRYAHGPLDAAARKALAEQFKAASGGQGFDVVYDAIGGDYAEPALRAIAWQGRYLVVGFAAGEIPKIALNLTLLKGCQIVGVWWGEWARRDPTEHRRNTQTLLDLHRQGKIKPFISERFPLAEGGRAIAHLASRKALGKVVVTID